MAALGAALLPARGRAQAPAAPDPWPPLATQIFGEQPLREDGETFVALDAPSRAEDAALVPVTLRVVTPATDTRQVRRITLVIDNNPSPVAAVFGLEPSGGVDSISTRVRVDSYTNMHVVAELDDGSLHMSRRFVKAAGGCSAPALKQEAGGVPLGTLRFRRFLPGSGRPEAEIMVRHPNYSGMQMDQVTRLYIPADFVRSVRIWQGEALILTVEGGISIAENPAFRFSYRDDRSAPLRAEVVDSQDRTFQGAWPVGVGTDL